MRSSNAAVNEDGEVDPKAADAWTDPDTSLIDDGLPPAPTLHLRWLRSCGAWIGDYAASKSAPVGYALAAVLAAGAAAIGSARVIEARANWREFPALWVLMVGPPSSHKTPILAPILAALKEIERSAATDFDVVRRQFETKRQEARDIAAKWEGDVRAEVHAGRLGPIKPVEADEPEEPKPPRIVVNDATIEAMAPLLKANPRGLLLARDELSGFIGNVDKFGGDGNVGFWLERFGGAPFTVDRKGGGSLNAPIGLVSIVGGIQPDRVQEQLLGRADDGFVSRFLMIYPAPVVREWETPVVDMELLKRALARLRTLAPASVGGNFEPEVIPLHPDAANVFKDWWVENGAEAEASEGFRAGLLGKAPGVVLRLALILEFMEWAWGDQPEPASVSRASVANALLLYQDFLLPSALRVIGGVGCDKGEAVAASLLRQIRLRSDNTVNAKDIYRNWGLPGLTKAATVNAALDLLAERGWVRRRRETGFGRPANDWAVNAKLWEAKP